MTVQKRVAKQRTRRRFRVRNHVRRSANGRPRLSVHRSNKHLYAQIIDDTEGRTLVAAATIEKALFGAGKAAGNADAAAKVGELIAERAAEKGITTVIFDRGLYKYHGRVKAFADAARSKGLEF